MPKNRYKNMLEYQTRNESDRDLTDFKRYKKGVRKVEECNK